MIPAALPRLAAALLVGAALLSAAPAEAGRRDHGRYDHRDDPRGWSDRGWSDRDYREGYRDGRRDARRWARTDGRRDWRDDRRVVVYPGGWPTYGHGYGPPPRPYGPPRWARGHRIHDYGWAPTYVVVDYPRYGLRHPPRGYHWRRDERGDWLLVAIATGVILDIVLD